MFSGLVMVGMLTAFGTVTCTVFVITGIVIRKMISNTSMMSTSGVVLISDMMPRSSSPDPMLIDMADLLVDQRSTIRTLDTGTTDQIGMQIAGKVPDVVLDDLVPAQQPVVAHDRRNGDRETDGGHDQRLTDGTRDAIDARLAGNTDGDQRLENTDNGAEQTDERCHRAYGREEREAAS